MDTQIDIPPSTKSDTKMLRQLCNFGITSRPLKITSSISVALPIYNLSLMQNLAAERLPGLATKSTKTQIVTFVLFVVKQLFYQVAPDIEKGRTSGLPAR